MSYDNTKYIMLITNEQNMFHLAECAFTAESDINIILTMLLFIERLFFSSDKNDGNHKTCFISEHSS